MVRILLYALLFASPYIVHGACATSTYDRQNVDTSTYSIGQATDKIGVGLFTVASSTVSFNSIDINVAKVGNPTGSLYAVIWVQDAVYGTIRYIESARVAPTSVGTSKSLVTLRFGERTPTIQAGQPYVVGVLVSATGNASNNYMVYGGTTNWERYINTSDELRTVLAPAGLGYTIYENVCYTETTASTSTCNMASTTDTIIWSANMIQLYLAIFLFLLLATGAYMFSRPFFRV